MALFGLMLSGANVLHWATLTAAEYIYKV